MSVAFTTDPQEIYNLSLPEGADVSQVVEMAELADSLALDVEGEWEELPPRIQDALADFSSREDEPERVVDAWRQIRGYLPDTQEKKALNDFFNAIIRLRDATQDAIKRSKSRGPFREYTDEEIERWAERDELPPDLAEWVKANPR